MVSSDVPSPPPASEGFVIAAGLRASRATLERWRRDPAPVLVPWFAGALAISVALLAAVWAVSRLTTPDPTPVTLPGINDVSGFDDYAHILGRNLLVLALHATACVAGFIAGSALPAEANEHTGPWRRVHQLAGPVAIAFVAAATLFSLGMQALVLGSDASTLAHQLDVGPALLILTLLPHALPELVALFLPLAAWLVASRRGRFDELLAATVATTALAVPVLVAAALVEVFVWPGLLRAASPLA